MYVLVGNANAIEIEGDSIGSGAPKTFKRLEGERTTTIRIPDGTGLMDAFVTVLHSLKYHLAPGEAPAWIESDNKSLRKLLVEHFGLQITKSDRPEGWGEQLTEE